MQVTGDRVERPALIRAPCLPGLDLVRRGVIGPDESTVICITGNGYKTMDVMAGRVTEPIRLGRGFKEFEGWWESRQAALA